MNLDKLKLEINKIKEKKDTLKSLIDRFERIILIGNGGSNSISSHISQDYTKELNKKAICFSDPLRLTCYINDYGRDEAYKEFIKDFATQNTLIILISSSGNSMNIFNSAVYCKASNIPMILLSGFDKNNKLNTFDGGILKYWVDSYDYGVVECAHLIFLHSILGK